MSVDGRTLRVMRSGRQLSLVLCLLLAATTAGCGGDPAPRAWAVAVCTALGPWRAEIGTLESKTQQQMIAKTPPGTARENLVRLFGSARNASETARAAVQQAGTPDVSDGARIAGDFAASLSAIRDAYGRARDGIGALATDPPKAFYDQVTVVVAKLGEDYDRSEPDITRLSSAELQQEFADAPECR